MRLSELIRKDLIKVELAATNKWEAIEELTDLLISAGVLHSINRDDVVEAVSKREGSLTTGLGQGLAVPHGAVSCVDEVLAVLGTSRRGIPFESLDGQPTHLVVLLLIPKGAFQRHVRTLAGIISLGADGELRRGILQASTAGEIMAVICDTDETQMPESRSGPRH